MTKKKQILLVFTLFFLFEVGRWLWYQKIYGEIRVSIDAETGYKTEATYINDLREGVSKTYYPSGELQTVEHYIKGKKEGWAEVFNKNGKRFSKVHYVDGVREGEASFYDEAGNLKSKIYFENDHIIRSSKVAE